MYNLYNPEPKSFLNLSSYKKYLQNENIAPGSIRSYISDVRHFLGWLILFLKTNRISTELTSVDEQILFLLKHVNQKTLSAYRIYLSSNDTPEKTQNRRFSSLRRFGSFCVSQNWVNENPFDILRNVSQGTPYPENKYHLAEFRNHLWKNNAGKLTIKNYLSDIKQYLAWSKK